MTNKFKKHSDKQPYEDLHQRIEENITIFGFSIMDIIIFNLLFILLFLAGSFIYGDSPVPLFPFPGGLIGIP